MINHGLASALDTILIITLFYRPQQQQCHPWLMAFGEGTSQLEELFFFPREIIFSALIVTIWQTFFLLVSFQGRSRWPVVEASIWWHDKMLLLSWFPFWLIINLSSSGCLYWMRDMLPIMGEAYSLGSWASMATGSRNWRGDVTPMFMANCPAPWICKNSGASEDS